MKSAAWFVALAACGGSPPSPPAMPVMAADVAGADVATVPDVATSVEIDAGTDAKDGTDAVDVGWSCDPDARPLPNPVTSEAAGVGPCPAGMVAIDTFCIDRYEASMVEVAATGAKPWSPFWNPKGHTVRAVSIAGAVPQAYVSGVQAKAACTQAGKRLCTDAEWLRACRGPQKWMFPYGNTLQTGVCNDHRAQHPAIEHFGTAANWIWSKLDNACLDQLPASLARAGEFAGCVTPEGVHDLMGNLHEWTADPAGTFRGGYFVDTKLNGPGCLYVTTAHDMGHWDYSTGFRCCATP